MRRNIDVELIMAIFTALIVVEIHKDEIGIQYFPRLIKIPNPIHNEGTP
ncbi:hypothetical protein ACFHWD_17685 [Clostridium sp. MT-14]|uniref:Uncharacterized protein n=1 Tax=Clostridium aromativorans TaxID=2836848 RepID=A0ABS8NA91_9CLOT|nr:MULTISPECIES: hypothetical protein [Clostridium]MCC9296695.1 hypothetical protein [Clostridium aromativorans]CAB1261948.1 hypothetical protein CLOSBL3_20154 [Clostridiaceae bacterium BL-3]